MMQVYSKAMSVVRWMGALADEVARRDADLARQLRRAVSSVPLNIAEAEHGRGKRGQASFAVALGSARESRACVDVAVALGYVMQPDDTRLDELDHVIAMLYRLSR